MVKLMEHLIKKKINKNIEIEIEKQRTVISNTFIVNFATGIEIITRFLSWTTGPPYSAVLTVSYPNTLQLFQKKKKNYQLNTLTKYQFFFKKCK